ncbi:D-gamma-glutamyl-meso-diaminopimelic acid endopeptidase CwlS/peptidoglycan endopeptidase LytE [Ureibacillus xyleni]|uniref:D-gamma-glutamyl-meso-diaminopimelic acid endopeptidase CwlS/peptidoglycan endopeptidase LytE n=1 Tax=Ureibacillus xyleni TaxID=614648 RepID=A0A285TJT8_9BACL|nr:peptidoglycan endopeptidase [Ureibacillus xyleni]SOC22684.1 D-gamma-glutamyl-meso-diaminopimelic acid endopeptidase CwlS/peptidoglycan endopeptidase LytE [Ureibacillus xyleni]
MKKQLLTVAASVGIMFSAYSAQASAHELTYKVQTGDTLWRIASSNNIAVSDLQAWNNLGSNTILVGQELTLLAPHSHSTYSSYTVKSGDTLTLIARNNNITVTELKSINQLTTDIINIGQVLNVPNVAAAPQAPVATKTDTYVVQSGDSLWGVAAKHSLSVDQLKSLNGLTSNTINVGQVLKVSTTAASNEVAPTTSLKTYTVQAGDTLWGIATKNGITVDQLKSFNGLTSNVVNVGQVLKLSSDSIAPVTEKAFNVDALIAEGKKYIGVPYVWGGSTPKGFDCSGFLNYVFGKVGVSIPRTVETIWNATTSVSSPQKGDLVFYTTYKAGPSHAGIYLGDNTFLHASSSVGIIITSMDNPYWKARYLGAKKVNL